MEGGEKTTTKRPSKKGTDKCRTLQICPDWVKRSDAGMCSLQTLSIHRQTLRHIAHLSAMISSFSLPLSLPPSLATHTPLFFIFILTGSGLLHPASTVRHPQEPSDSFHLHLLTTITFSSSSTIHPHSGWCVFYCLSPHHSVLHTH